MRYRKKPIEVEAFRLRRDMVDAPDWLWGLVGEWSALSVSGPRRLRVDTPAGVMTAGVGDYIVREATGEVRPWSAAAFEAAHEPAGER